MISRPPRMALRKSMAKNFLLLNYHAFVAIHTPIAVTFSTPTPYSDLARRNCEMGFAQQCGLVGSVQICVVGDGVQVKGSPSPASAMEKPGVVGFRHLLGGDK